MTATALQQDRALAGRLSQTWPAFFETFGRLTRVQRAAIPPILDGEDVLVCSATASGKTEAACAPLVERFLGRRRSWTVLYVSPTRALVNDLYERLSYPLARLGLRLARRTGDHRDDLHHIPNVLLTTPESFDSLLCRGRRRDANGHVLTHAVALVLDEVHLLYGTPRGEQVRYLLHRLRRLREQALREGWAADAQVQVVGLSATVPDIVGVVRAYLPGGRVVTVHGGREIEVAEPPGGRVDVEGALPAYLRSLVDPEKVLVFSNARRRVDDLAAELRIPIEQLGYEVHAHHGSLTAREREATERAAKTREKLVVFATSTLEIGIDIGDIDLVVLDGPAPSVPALLQRIGRGNRRSGVTRVMVCAGSLAEVLVQSAMIEAARDGWLGPSERGPHHAVARQQVASYIFQAPTRSRGRQALQRFLDDCAAAVVSRSLLSTMLADDELWEDASGIRLGEEWLEKASRGAIHANIEQASGASVSDELTGEGIATGVEFRGGRGLRVGGHLLQVRRWNERSIEVRRVRDQQLAAGQWGYVSRAWFSGAGQPQTVRRYLGLGDNQWPIIGIGHRTLVFHFGGARRRAVLQLALRHGGRRGGGVEVNNWFLAIPGMAISKPAWLTEVGPALLETSIVEAIDSLERTLGRPYANNHLPLETRVDEVHGWLAVEDELRASQLSEWVRVDEGTALALELIAGDLEAVGKR